MRIYLDACCVNRLTDDQTQDRIREESAVIQRILRGVRRGDLTWIGSEVLSEGIDRNPLPNRKRENRALLALASELIEISDFVIERALYLESVGYGAFDAMHLACAEDAGADVLLRW